MKTIKLTQGKVAFIDDEDFEYVNQFKWYAVKDDMNWYAVRYSHTQENGKREFYQLHRIIMKAIKGEIIDHKDRDGLNCQKHNLRISTCSQNGANRRSARNSTSKYLGVYLKIDKRDNSRRWTAQLTYNKKNIYIGAFKTEENAAIAYNIFAEKHHGDFANYNKPIL